MSTEKPAGGKIGSTGYDATLLPDGSTLVTRRSPRRGLSLTREEWRISGDRFEVHRSWLGARRVRRFSHGSVWLEHHRRQASPCRALVLRAGGEACLLADGDEQQLRVLGALIAERAGWRFRVSQAAAEPNRAAALPLPAVLIVAGLITAFAGFWQARSEAAAIHRLKPISAADLATLPPSATALATGTVGGAALDGERGFIVYDAYGVVGRSRTGMSWMLIDSARPSFSLTERYGAIPISGAHAMLDHPPHRARDGMRRYEGFRGGDTATILGRVSLTEGGRRALSAQTIFGGSPEAFARSLQREGLFLGSVGLASAASGVLLLRAFWRPG